MSLLDIRKNRGDLWDAATWNRHLEEIDRFLRSLGVTPGGTVRRDSTGTIYLPLSVEAGDSAGEWALRVGYGLLGGLEPKIDDQRVSKEDPDTGETPTLTVGSNDFSDSPDPTSNWPKGVSFIYGVVEFDQPSWNPTGSKIVAQAKTWTVTPWKAARLIGLLQRDDPDDNESDVSVRQLTFFNQALTLSKKGANGLARYWWRAAA